MSVRACLFAMALLCAGCSSERSGVERHWILGFGCVTVNKTNVAAVVTRVQAVGAYYNSGLGSRFAVGYTSGSTVQIQSSVTNMILEVK